MNSSTYKAERLRVLAAFSGCSMSEYVRRFVTQAWAERQGA